MAKPLFLLSILLILGLYFVYLGLTRYLFLRKIEDTPTSKAGSAPVGLVELSGTAKPYEPKKSPVNDALCVFWRITGEYFKEGKNGGWRNIYSADSKTPFYVADETGRLLVMPEGAEIEIPSHSSHKGYIMDTKGWFEFESHQANMDECALKFILSLDNDSRQKFLAHKQEEIRVNEYIIREHDPLYVLGTATPVEDPSGPGGRDALVVRKGTTDKTLFISNTGEGYVIDEFSSSLYLMIFGGLAEAVVCLGLILVLLGV